METVLLGAKNRLSVLLVAAIATVAISGCQQQEEEPTKNNEQARQVAITAQQYINAQRTGDWQQMCTLLDNPSRQALQRNTKSPSIAACAQALGSAPAEAQKALQQSAEGVRVIKAAVRGNQGEALVKVPTGRKLAQLYKIDGQWRVSIAE